ncbi:MAG: hypothetical protein VXW32_08705, partial [Myxococcota bacterium]|nr:hypothetical protein [Myxococcota bacterium]
MLHSWVGAAGCCGEDPHPVHGAVLGDSSVVLVGKNDAGRDGTSGFVTRWMLSETPVSGRLVDEDAGVIQESLVLDSSSALVQVIEVGERIVAVGFESDSASGPATALALVLNPETLEVLSRLELQGPDEGSSAVFESLAVTANGELLIGGSWGSSRSEIEGLKSYGNIWGGRGVLIQLDVEAWFASESKAVGLQDLGATLVEVPEVHSLKSIAVSPLGEVVAVGHDDAERSGVVWFESGLLDYQWPHFDDGIELTAVELVSEDNGDFSAVVAGHGGEGVIDGHVKKVD